MEPNLFLDDPNGLAKFAAAFTRLSENADDWQAEIIDELYRQAPYVGDFEPNLVMNELDAEKRYALGGIQLRNKQSVNPRDDSTPSAMQGVNSILIPVIVKEGKMSPLDVFIHSGKTQPLTEGRLRRAMFRPQLFEAAAKRPGDQDIMSTLYPPYRSGGFGLGGNSFVGQQETAKTSSVATPLLDAIHYTIKESDVKRLEDMLNEDHTLQAAVVHNEAFRPFLTKLAEPIEQVDPRDMVKRAAESIYPTVIQISQISGGFKIKTANPGVLAPESNDIDKAEAENVVGKDIVKQVETDGTVTVTTDPVVRDSLEDAKIKVVDEFGEYKVKTKDGRELMGWVFPRVVDLDGTNIALAVFSNGSECAVQENIAASPVGKGTNIIDENPSGYGCFYLAKQGSAVAIIPITIKGESTGTDNSKMFVAETMLGDSVRIKLVPGLNKIAKISDNTYGIPEDCGWLPLKSSHTELATDASGFTKTAEARSIQRRVEVMYETSGTYSLRGLPIEKLASVQPIKFVNHDQAMYDLALLGVDPQFAKEKLAEAQKLSRWCAVEGVRPITLASEVYQKAKTAAAETLKKMPQVKSLLLKEAAALDDPMSVDKVLSVGFLNPENIGTFISYLPEFEDTVKKLSELLVASRLGLSTVDVGALERVVKHLDKVIGGLRELSQHPSA